MDNDRVARNQEDQQAALDKAIKEQQSQNQVLPGYTVDTFDAAAVTELKTEDLKVGEGPEVPAGATVKANYTGWLADGTIFDSSNKNGTVTPISFSLNGVIAGWTEGIPGMKVGGVRKLTIPADKAYGASGTNGIPPNSPLVFVVEIVGIE
ncbi:FKBP-type peptidyl-prolyl cis-trans isomerase [Candidatus Saccharibacteria bacterium]|nr:FKBP-type peptidyl-prolyl cis-trans isomerase [Candidatus Saccharibacteria bacterium]